MNKLLKLTAAVLSILMMLSWAAMADEPAEAQIEVNAPLHPLVSPQKTGDYIHTENRFTNILLLGVDHGYAGYWGSANKRTLDICHTDAFVVLSINMDTDEVNMISIPRDTVTYIPGINGMYKLNAAFNCSETLEEGFENCCNAASWLLGGIEIDYYACVDMNAMVKLGDKIGGADVDVEMSYTGNSKRHYKKGYQHLDGQGLMDYARARKNATVNANDLGRTGRQRQVIEGIARTLKNNTSLIKSTWNYATGGEINFFTNMKLANVLNLASKLATTDKIGSYVFSGEYRNRCDWLFTITDQTNRRQVIKTVYGVDVPGIDYASSDGMYWLDTTGFEYVAVINKAAALLDEAKAADLTDEQKATVDAFGEKVRQARVEFSNTAYASVPDNVSVGITLDYKDCKKALDSTISEMKKLGDEVQEMVHPGEKLKWFNKNLLWFQNSYINEYLPVWG